MVKVRLGFHRDRPAYRNPAHADRAILSGGGRGSGPAERLASPPPEPRARPRQLPLRSHLTGSPRAPASRLGFHGVRALEQHVATLIHDGESVRPSVILPTENSAGDDLVVKPAPVGLLGEERVHRIRLSYDAVDLTTDHGGAVHGCGQCEGELDIDLGGRAAKLSGTMLMEPAVVFEVAFGVVFAVAFGVGVAVDDPTIVKEPSASTLPLASTS